MKIAQFTAITPNSPETTTVAIHPQFIAYLLPFNAADTRITTSVGRDFYVKGDVKTTAATISAAMS